jgi:DNA-directed RNA polymerase specialized sigma24 family protein
MEELEGSARGVSLRAAASMVAGDARDPVAGQRVRRAVDAQLRRAGIETQDAGDVRTEVVLALLSAPAAELPLPLELVCARASAIARNKAIDHGRRRARAPLALGDALPEPPQPGRRPGSLADGLDDVAAAAHIRRVRADLAGALGRLDAPQRAAISAHAQGGAAGAAGLPRSTYYRALGHAQALLQSDLRGRLAGYGALGGIAQRAREIFAHVEAVHAAAAAATVAVAISAAVVVTVHDEAAHHFAPPAAVVRVAGGRVQPPPAVPARPRSLRHRVTVVAPNRPATASRHAPVATPARTRASCPYDPSSYDC